MGEKVSYTFSEEGVFPYVCILHPGMIGAIVVGDGIGPATKGSVTGGMIVPPGDDTAATDTGTDAAAPAAQATAARSDQNPWLLGAAVLIAVTFAGAVWLPRRKTQSEV